jgi:hypothetical protein
MREHIEVLIAALTGPRRDRVSVPRRRRPRLARTTYVAVLREPAARRLAH